MNRIYYTEFGSYLLNANLTVAQVAKKCNVGLKTVYNWINKVNVPTDVKTINRLSDVLKIDVEILKDYFKEV